MKKRTRFLSLFTALVLCFAVACCFIGCGGELGTDGITLSATTLTVEEGKSAAITAVVIDETIEWEIADETIVSVTKVKSGVYSVTGLKAGTTTITAKAGDKTATCTVTVTKAKEEGGDEQGGDEEDEVTVTLSATTLSVEAGKTAEITATVSGTEEALAWEIGDDTVVSIAAAQGSTYTVTGLKEGSTTVTAKVGDKTATCTVTVTAAEQGGDEDEVTVTLSATTLSVEAGKTAEITATVSGTEEELSWEIGDDTVVSIAAAQGSTYTVTGIKEGSTTITAKVGEKTAECTVTVTAATQGGDEEDETQDVSSQVKFNDKFGANGIQFRVEMQAPEYAELVQQIDPSKTEVTVTVDGVEASSSIGRKEWQAEEVYNLWIQVLVGDGKWEQDYVFKFSFKNADGDVVACATYTEVAPKILNLDNTTLNLTLAADETVTGTITATKNNKVEGDIEWTVDDESIATIAVSDDGLTVTVTAVKQGTAIVTATADGLTKTCTVNVLEDGEEAPVIVITDISVFEAYGDHYYKILFGENDENVDKYPEIKEHFDHTNIDGVECVHREFFQGGGAKTYINTIKFNSEPESGKTYKIDLCDANGNILATYNWTAPIKLVLTIDNTKLELTLKDGETVTGTITATKENIDADIEWTIDGSEVATITVSEDKLSVTVTALKKGTATITAKAGGLEKTCKVTVLADGEVVEKPQSTFELTWIENYGAHYMKFSGIPEDLTYDVVKVYKGDVEVGRQTWFEKLNGGLINIHVTETANDYDDDYKIEFINAGQVVATVYFTYPIAA